MDITEKKQKTSQHTESKAGTTLHWDWRAERRYMRPSVPEYPNGPTREFNKNENGKSEWLTHCRTEIRIWLETVAVVHENKYHFSISFIYIYLEIEFEWFVSCSRFVTVHRRCRQSDDHRHQADRARWPTNDLIRIWWCEWVSEWVCATMFLCAKCLYLRHYIRMLGITFTHGDAYYFYLKSERIALHVTRVVWAYASQAYSSCTCTNMRWYLLQRWVLVHHLRY